MADMTPTPCVACGTRPASVEVRFGPETGALCDRCAQRLLASAPVAAGRGPAGLRPRAPQPEPTSKTPALDEFGRALTDDARAGRIAPVIGRAEEIEQTIEILARRRKNNAVLIGEPGVGKTA